MDALIHIANLFLLFSLALKDILWLRLLNVAASIFFLLFFSLQPKPMWSFIFWNILFMLVNFYRIWFLYLERRPVKLSEDEQHLYQMAFRSLTLLEFSKLMQFSTWKSARRRYKIIYGGKEIDQIFFIYSGSVGVFRENEKVAELGAGRFVGELSFLTEKESSADVLVLEDTRYVEWSSAPLKKFLDEHPALKISMQLILGDDMAKKLQHMQSPDQRTFTSTLRDMLPPYISRPSPTLKNPQE